MRVHKISNLQKDNFILNSRLTVQLATYKNMLSYNDLSSLRNCI